MMNQNMFKQMTFYDILDLEDTIKIDERKTLRSSFSNYKVVGYSQKTVKWYQKLKHSMKTI